MLYIFVSVIKLTRFMRDLKVHAFGRPDLLVSDDLQ